jgi:pSer/pThr/pTyr-binding forkhead associated (FHA) protein
MAEIIVTLGDSVVGKYPFSKDVLTIGRSRDNDVVIANLAVSRNHAQIRCKEGDYLLSDLNSTNGTYVNGVRVTRAEVRNGDVITIGKHVLLFKNFIRSKGVALDALDEERTILVEKEPVAYAVITRGKQKDTQFRIDKAEVTIGRGAGCDICLHDWFCSKQHAVIHRRGNAFFLRDLGSWRGTKVNEAPVTETVLKNGDEIHIGSTRILFRTEMLERGPARVRPLEEQITPMPDDMAPVAELPFEQPEPGNGKRTPAPELSFAALEGELEPPLLEEDTESVAGSEAPQPPQPVAPLESLEPVAGEPARDFEAEDEGPITAGSEEDFIEPSLSPVEVRPEEKAEADDMLFQDLQELLDRSVERVIQSVPAPVAALEMVKSAESSARRESPFEDLDEEIREPAAARPGEIRSAEKGPAPALAAVEPGVPEDERVERDESADEPFPEREAQVEAMIEPVVEVVRSASAPELEPVEAPLESAASEPEGESTREQLEEIHMWEMALQNRSPLIRRLAAKTLKKLTGKDYEY